ncbi:COMM domain-containing protein 4 isoform X2 [Loxodonta africana]|uniref:COMM domain-containing protein 4 isoform X2 n=1 Tax=Loxodonta africana TaxID=9785 RepID=UPI000C81340B|nr:COMM domain-containing protein 4 isoform X2 [Loxodonta africana]
MRFRFCGDLDCPDWVLAEISTLAKISSVKLRLLCSQVLKELLGQGIDYEKILKLTADAKFESGDVKATVAVLSFILSSAAKHSVDGESLSSELQQLGLPKEHAASLCRCYEEKQSLLQEHLRACSLRGPGSREHSTPSCSEQAGRRGLAGGLHTELQPPAVRGGAHGAPAAGGGIRPGCQGPACRYVPLSRKVPGPTGRTEAGTDPDELPGLRRTVFRAQAELPYPCQVAALGTSPWAVVPAPRCWVPGLLGPWLPRSSFESSA